MVFLNFEFVYAFGVTSRISIFVLRISGLSRLGGWGIAVKLSPQKVFFHASVGIRKQQTTTIERWLSTEITKLISEAEIENQARKYGFIQRTSKLTGWKFLDMLLFTHFNHQQLSLNQLAIELKLRYGISISKQAIDVLHKRL